MEMGREKGSLLLLAVALLASLSLATAQPNAFPPFPSYAFPLRGSRPAAPEFPPGVDAASLQSRPWQGARGGEEREDEGAHRELGHRRRYAALLGSQHLIQVDNQAPHGEDYSVQRGVSNPIDDAPSSLEANAFAQASQGGRDAHEDQPPQQNNDRLRRVAPPQEQPPPQEQEEPQIEAQSQPSSPPPSEQAPPQQAETYDVHLYDASMIRALTVAAQMNLQSARMMAMAPMYAASAGMMMQPNQNMMMQPSQNMMLQQGMMQQQQQASPLGSVSPQPSSLSMTWPKAPSYHSGFPLTHPFGAPPTPMTENFGALPQYPPRFPSSMASGSAMEFERRSSGVF